MAGLLTPPDHVAAELRRWAADPFDPVRDNCGMSVLRYVERVLDRRLSPAPRFTTDAGAALMLERAGGFRAYCAWALARLGCPHTDAPGRGDVGLAELERGLTAVIALDSRRIAARAGQAVVIRQATLVVAWGVRCHRR